ncbi:hypothetical protein BDP55DRAFT_655983 [Colletotrichum godetiae]|uniref:Uncharacterized protein n=1 Tax=Colletotrichum godetiae TaxID=1209918 RepID=A0AAJ0AQE3_9PEZI|nr:uncharacterized protein BDP55DRAFT_655983 [Colletotrichum godetiae]KAK1688462.1 hypothetical protein BDP55DRAFT_655983 [Colletotrichum godetiae]
MCENDSAGIAYTYPSSAWVLPTSMATTCPPNHPVTFSCSTPYMPHWRTRERYWVASPTASSGDMNLEKGSNELNLNPSLAGIGHYGEYLRASRSRGALCL